MRYLILSDDFKGVSELDATDALQPITEDDIAQFLVNTPDFFERHAEVLASVQLTSPHGKRAISLQERQVELLREKIRHLELRAADMIRHGHENVVIADRLQNWTRSLLQVRQGGDLPDVLIEQLKTQFGVPQAALRLWNLSDGFADLPCVQGLDEQARTFVDACTVPYCGPSGGVPLAACLPEPGAVASMTVVPLRTHPDEPVFGVLILGSDDPQRFHASMGTDFLERIGDFAAAALSRLC